MKKNENATAEERGKLMLLSEKDMKRTVGGKAPRRRPIKKAPPRLDDGTLLEVEDNPLAL